MFPYLVGETQAETTGLPDQITYPHDNVVGVLADAYRKAEILCRCHEIESIGEFLSAARFIPAPYEKGLVPREENPIKLGVISAKNQYGISGRLPVQNFRDSCVENDLIKERDGTTPQRTAKRQS